MARVQDVEVLAYRSQCLCVREECRLGPRGNRTQALWKGKASSTGRKRLCLLQLLSNSGPFRLWKYAASARIDSEDGKRVSGDLDLAISMFEMVVSEECPIELDCLKRR